MIEIHLMAGNGWILIPAVRADGNMIRRKSLTFCPVHAVEHVARSKREVAA